jgi:glycosyltransferase involved in cell wall biosynthesis
MIYFLSHPIQYFSPLLRALSQRTDLEVYYYTDPRSAGGIDKGFGVAVSWDIPLLEGYSYHFLDNKRKNRTPGSRLWDVFNPGIASVIRKARKQVVVINGWAYSSDWLVAIAAKMYGCKLWIRAENPLNQELRKSGKVRLVKKILLGKILFSFLTDKCLYIGEESRKFFRYYGVQDSKLVFTPYAVDNDFFSRAWLEYKNRLPQLKEELGLPAGKKIVLFTGKYIPKKRPMDLLEACRRMAGENIALVMVGDGELRPAMEEFIRSNGMQDVVLTGFINQSVIPRYYAVADVFVMCSGMGETWGLAVNEAMNFEKPVVVSDTCGSSADLVKPGVNGYTYQEGDIAALTDCIRKVLKDEEATRRMGKASLDIVQSYSVPSIVNNIQEEITG